MQNQTLQGKLNENLTKFKNNVAIEYDSKVVTYGHLDKRSNGIANWLLGRGITKETFIGVLANDRIEFISAMLGVFKAGGVFVPLDTANPTDRLKKVIEVTNVSIILMDECNYMKYSGIDLIGKGDVELAVIKDLLEQGKALDFTERPMLDYSSEDKIYIYFTSATTGTPKAVAGKNIALLNFCQWEVDTLKIDENFRMSQFSTTGFDAFLKEVLVTFFSGGTLCVPGNMQLLFDAETITRWVEMSRISLLHCVPTIFRLLSSGKLTGTSFKNLKYILLSGEKIYPSDLKNWYNTIDERIQIINLYGTTETTILNSYYFIWKSDINRKSIPIGKPIRGSGMIILDRDMNICNKGVVGEIYIRNRFGLFGYHNSPEMNNKKFIPNPFSNDPGDFIFRSGDLGRLLIDGNIEIMGRIDRQVKLRGVRIELEEVEGLLMDHPFVKEAAAIKKEASHHNELLCTFVSAGEPDEWEQGSFIDALEQYLSEKLPSYIQPVLIIKVEEIPRKPNGKVDYKTLIALSNDSGSNYNPPRDNIEKKLLDIWQEILKVEKIGVKNRFFELGGNSLHVMSLIYKIHKEFDVRISIGDIFSRSTIEEQAEIIKGAREERYNSIDKAEKKEYYALSSAQKRVYFMRQMEGDSMSYNIPRVFVLQGNLEKEKLENAFRELVKRHESFRTSFHLIKGEPAQRIHDDVDFTLECLTLPGQDIQKIMDDFAKPFNLDKAPLLRAALVESAERKYILAIDMYHIITDGASDTVLVKDLIALYNGEALPPLKIQYKDFSEWHNVLLRAGEIKKQEAFWLKNFEGGVPTLSLPIDYLRPSSQSFEGRRIGFEIGPEETKALRELALKEQITMFMLLLAVYNILLSKITGQEDIVVGSPAAGRSHAELASIIGMFVNTLALRNKPIGSLTFKVFLGQVKTRTLEAFENQDYQFEDLVEKIASNRDLSRNPIFDVMIQLQNLDTLEIEIPGLRLIPYKYDRVTSKFDFNFIVKESEEMLILAVEYNTKLYKEETVEKFILYFKNIISAVIDGPGRTISEIKRFSPTREKAILKQFNDDLET